MNVNARHVVIGFLTFVCFVKVLRNYHENWLIDSEQRRKAELYINSEVCTKAELKAELGDWHKCNESKEQLGIPPFITAFYRTVESYSICGVSRCEDILQWIIWNKFWILFVSLSGAFIIYHVLHYNLKVKQLNIMTTWTLPNRRLHYE